MNQYFIKLLIGILSVFGVGYAANKIQTVEITKTHCGFSKDATPDQSCGQLNTVKTQSLPYTYHFMQDASCLTKTAVIYFKVSGKTRISVQPTKFRQWPAVSFKIDSSHVEKGNVVPKGDYKMMVQDDWCSDPVILFEAVADENANDSKISKVSSSVELK